MRGIDLKKIAEKMNGASGAELKVGINLDLHLMNYVLPLIIIFVSLLCLSINLSRELCLGIVCTESSCKHAHDYRLLRVQKACSQSLADASGASVYDSHQSSTTFV
jgi:hypothetical protein